MKEILITCLMFIFAMVQGTSQKSTFLYEVSLEHPFGLPNPTAPQENMDWAPLIGESSCTSVSRKPDQKWAEPEQMSWVFKYIMNGRAVQDETYRADGFSAGSIRQYNADSSRWHVHYYSSPSTPATLSAWQGGKKTNGDIILYKPQPAPNGMEGFYKISFTDINEKGFKWLGEWVNPDESIKYPTWKIDCTKLMSSTNAEDKATLLASMKAFSAAYIAGDFDAIADAYTEDGKIFPSNTSIIAGRDAIKKYWILPEGSTILDHRIMPEEIIILGNQAYDYGYYEGKTKTAKGDISSWKGKYVIVWKKVDGKWLIHLDIWNRV